MNYRLRKAIEKQHNCDWYYPIFDSDNPLPQSQRELKQLLIDCRHLGIDKICTAERTPYTIDVLSAIKMFCHRSFEIDEIPYRVEHDYFTHEPIYVSQPGFVISL